MTAIALLLAIAAAGPALPFPHQAQRYEAPGNRLPGFDTESTWRDLLLSDDGLFAVFGQTKFIWTDLPKASWSGEEIIFYDKGRSEAYTTSQEAHLPRSRLRSFMTYVFPVACFSDHSVLITGGSSLPNQLACLVEFDSRGKRPNPIIRLTPLPTDRVLARLSENLEKPTTTIDYKAGFASKLTPIIFERSGDSIRARFGEAIHVLSDHGTDPGGVITADLRSRRVLTEGQEFVVGQPSGDIRLREYSNRTASWRDVAAPPGFAHYQTSWGFFYWRGRLFFSPQVPDGIPDVHGQIHFAPMPGPGSPGLYQASADRKSWKRVADCQVLSLSASKSAWLVRDPSDGSFWIEHMG